MVDVASSKWFGEKVYAVREHIRSPDRKNISFFADGPTRLEPLSGPLRFCEHPLVLHRTNNPVVQGY